MKTQINKAAELIRNSNYTVGFTGAGISVESGIPPFRGDDGLWSEYDPMILDLNRYYYGNEESWPVIKRLFFDFFGSAKPNTAHKVLAEWEANGMLQTVITQNIDNLHQEAGSKSVYEYHGNSRQFICLDCGKYQLLKDIKLTSTAPVCSVCGGLLKPDFIFFGEQIPEPAASQSVKEARKADLFIIIGTSGEIIPASNIPFLAKKSGAKIIEINTEEGRFTDSITDIFLQGKAGSILPEIQEQIKQML
ncbi:MAG: NAD-dependent deacylase [Bacteroidota bacterium]|nr:NAD-dependent deacylase [Bacteroidota bacterium]